MSDTQTAAANGPSKQRGRLPLAGALWLTAICALLYLPGLATLPPIDRDEARFIQATKQMIESGDYINIRMQDELRTKKPVGIHWVQAASVQTLAGGDVSQVWAYRVPSALGAWIAVLVTAAMGARLVGVRAGLAAGTLLAASAGVVAEAHMAKTDGLLLACAAVCAACLARLYRHHGEAAGFRLCLTFWTALGLGILLKGPVILLPVFGALISLSIVDRNVRWLRALHPEAGLPIVVAIVGPWLLMQNLLGEGSFVLQALQEDLFPKLVSGQEGHGAPPGTHLLASLLTLWPMSALAPLAGWLIWTKRKEPTWRFCAAWIIPAYVVFELVPTKLPHYTLPLFPAIAVACAAALQQAEVARWQRLASAGVWLVGFLAVGAVLSYSWWTFSGKDLLTGLMLAGGAVVALGLAIWGRTERPWTRALTLCVGAGLFWSVTFGQILPRAEDFQVSPRLAQAISNQDHEGPVVLAGYSEPSAVFLLGTDTVLTNGSAAATLLASDRNALVAVERRQEDAFQLTLRELGQTVDPVGRVDGYNYSRGDWVSLGLYRKATP